MTKFLNLTEARNTFPKVIEDVEKGDQIIITKRGKPAAFIIKIDSNMLETVSIMEDREIMRKIKKAREDIKANRLHSYKEVFGEDDE
jgi:prevent-host-death family protein